MMRRYSLLFACCCAVLTLACKPKSSKEFVQAQGQYELLVTRQGDDAYASPDMAAVVELLGKVSPESKHAADAKALLEKIEGEKKRIAAEQAAAAQARADAESKARAAQQALAAATAGSPSDVAGSPQGNGAAQAAAVTVENPPTGMAQDAFEKKYGDCTSGGPAVQPPGVTGKVTSLALRSTDACLKRFGGTTGATTLFVFVDGKLNGRMLQSQTTTKTPGVPPTLPSIKLPPAPPEPEAPFMPGMPQPGAKVPEQPVSL